MAFKFELVAYVLALVIREGRGDEENSWTDDFTVCNMYRLIEQECPDEQ